MARIHEYKPVLKTLFQIKTWKPGAQQWGQQGGLQISEESIVNVTMHSEDIAAVLLADEVWPTYIIQAYRNFEDLGFVTFSDSKGETIDPDDILLNPAFAGVRYSFELDLRQDRATVLRALYTRLKEICDAYAEEKSIEVDFDESYCWLGAHHKGLMPILQQGLKNG